MCTAIDVHKVAPTKIVAEVYGSLNHQRLHAHAPIEDQPETFDPGLRRVEYRTAVRLLTAPD